MKFSCVSLALACLSLCACSGPAQPGGESLDSTTASIASAKWPLLDEAALLRHIQTLSSDDFEGRGPSSVGEEKTVAYLQDEFRKIGLQPGNGDRYFQDVPLVTMTASANPMVIAQDGVTVQVLEQGPDVVMWSKRVTESVNLAASDMVFVGYGIVAPEYNWNDYAGIDVAGKTVVILVNDPGFATKDAKLFKGNAMTYYGRWTYKYEEAARQGAAGAIIVHETEPAAYPWAVVQGSWTGPQHDLVSADNNASRAKIEGWISHPQAQALFKHSGHDYEQARDAAKTRDFKPFALGVSATTSLTNDIHVADSKNVIATLPGTERPDEYIIFMAHWDHLGMDPALDDDPIYNGAVDNATGTAALLVLADAFKRAAVPPQRTLVFLAVTAEESGLLGSRYYAQHPIFPLGQTVAGFNIDAMNVTGRTLDVAVVGYGSSELEKYLAEFASAQGRTIVPEPTPEKGYFYRSDHFNLAKKGVPVLYAEGGNNLRNGGVAAGSKLAEDYVANRYHKPSDEYDAATWDLSGAMEDLALYYAIAQRLAAETTWPAWYPGTEFKAAREASQAGQ